MRITSLSLISVLVLGCGIEAESDVTDSFAPGAKADSADSADHDCKIVLRTWAQPFGLPTNHVDGDTWVVYEGTLDVADDADGAPRVLFSSRSTPGWWQIGAVPVSGASSGYQRYAFTLDRNTVLAGFSPAWREMRIELVPFLATSGHRLFDHNRYPNDYDNYVITADHQSYGDDPAVCH